jgi:AraC-like DNA-binding protein
MDKFGLFADKSRSVIRLTEQHAQTLEQLFAKMKEEELLGSKWSDDSMQAYLQLIMVEGAKIANFPPPDNVTDEFRHVHEFFRLLEAETAGINKETPIRIRTAKEFAADLAVHPNHLNALLKKHTGQNVSTHIKNRLLDETKVLLLQTDWSLQEIGYSIGYAEQPNFNSFFKKNTGITPAEFRKAYHL